MTVLHNVEFELETAGYLRLVECRNGTEETNYDHLVGEPAGISLFHHEDKQYALLLFYSAGTCIEIKELIHEGDFLCIKDEELRFVFEEDPACGEDAFLAKLNYGTHVRNAIANFPKDDIVIQDNKEKR